VPTLIKAVHTVTFLFMSACVAWIWYSGIVGRYDWTVSVAIAAILSEGIALAFNSWQCPLTSLAERHGAERGAVTQLFLPGWLVPHTFRICGALFALGLIILVVNYLV
jgi:hypothetical protein